MRMPILFDMEESARLHGIAHTAALQTGAKGEELDELTSDIFNVLASYTNYVTVKAKQKPLRLVEG